MKKREADILYFVAFCMEGYKNKHELSGKIVSELFDKYGIKEFLSEHYEVLHTQGMQWILDEIEERIGDEIVSRKSSDC